MVCSDIIIRCRMMWNVGASRRCNAQTWAFAITMILEIRDPKLQIWNIRWADRIKLLLLFGILALPGKKKKTNKYIRGSSSYYENNGCGPWVDLFHSNCSFLTYYKQTNSMDQSHNWGTRGRSDGQKLVRGLLWEKMLNAMFKRKNAVLDFTRGCQKISLQYMSSYV